MATLKNRLLQSEWWFYEHGGTSLFNELMRFAESTIGTLTGAVTFGDIPMTNATMIVATGGVPGTGAPIPPGLNQPGWGNGQQQIATTNPRPPTLDQP